MTTLSIEINAIEAKLKSRGVRLDAVLRLAGVNRTTWTRWKNKTVPGARYDTLSRVNSAVEAAMADPTSYGAAPKADVTA